MSRTPTAISSFLEGIDYPCSREELVDQAEENHAPESILDLLEMLPDRQYESITDVMMELARA